VAVPTGEQAGEGGRKGLDEWLAEELAEGRRQELIAEYAEVNQNFRMLADIRFRLLALIPTLGGVAIFLLSRLEHQAEPKPDYGLLLLISGLGLLATVGVTYYDQRNNELYGDLEARAKELECKLGLLGGQFLLRPPRGRHLFGVFKLGHDPGLALIYGAVLGAWFYPLTTAFLGWIGRPPEPGHVLPLMLAGVMAAVSIAELLRLDGSLKLGKLFGFGFRGKTPRQKWRGKAPSTREIGSKNESRAGVNRRERRSAGYYAVMLRILNPSIRERS
jgi:hypothetical protein